MSRPVLLCYDGSETSRHAIAEAARLLGGGPALVLHVSQSLAAFTPGYPLAGFTGGLEASAAELDAEAARRGKEIAEAGAAIAREAGFDPEPAAQIADGRVWESIVAVAADRGVSAVVMGSRGLAGLKSALLGSVSNGVVHHCHVPVLVVPPAGTDR